MKLAIANMFAFMVMTPVVITQARLLSNKEKRVLGTETDTADQEDDNINDYFAKEKSDDSSQEACGGISFNYYNYGETTGPKCPHVGFYIRSNYLAWEPYLSDCHYDVSSGRELTEELYGGYKNWKKKFHVKFDKEEEECKSLQNWIDRHVSFLQAGKKSKSFSMKHNQNSHLTINEVHNKYKIGISSPYKGYYNKSSTAQSRRVRNLQKWWQQHLPSEKNWVTENAVTSVKDQGDCGACWAFSAAGALEWLVYNETGKTEDLSVEQMINCNTNGFGCDGGIVDCSFVSEGYAEGLCTASADGYPLPYNATYDEDRPDQTCLTSSDECIPVPSSASQGHYQVADATEEGLMAALNVQTVSIAIDASSSEFQYYGSGIFNASSCGSKANHAVLLVGYGTDESTGADYWLLKNSWGTNWGEKGYMRLSRESHSSSGPCGIYISPSVPVSTKLVVGGPSSIVSNNCTGPTVADCEGSNQPGLKIFIQNNLPVDLVATGLYIYTKDTTVAWNGNQYTGSMLIDESNGNYLPVSSGTTNFFNAYLSNCADDMQFVMVFVPTDTSYRKSLQQVNYYIYANQNGTTNAVVTFIDGNYTDEQLQIYQDGLNSGQCYGCEFNSPSSSYGGDYITRFYCIKPECTDGGVDYQCPSDISLLNNACPFTPVPDNTTGDVRTWYNEVSIDSSPLDNQIITMAIFEQLQNDTVTPVTFTNYSGYWNYIGQNIDRMEITMSSSWDTSQESEVQSAFEGSIELGSSITFKLGIGVSLEAEMSTSLTSTFEKQRSEAVENSKGGSWSLTCNTPTCADGNLYQWRQEMSAVSSGVAAGQYYMEFCSFVCVPSMLSTAVSTTSNLTIGAPKCPETACSDNTCQCCNQLWDGTDDYAANNLNQANGGVCSPCNQAGSPCEVDGDCCSLTCLSNDISTCSS